MTDARFALRGFRRTPGFVITAVLILGLGIGMSVAMYTVFDAVLRRPLPVVQQDRIVVLWNYRQPGVEFPLQPKDVTELRHTTRTMRGVAAFAHWGAFAFALVDGDQSLVIPQSVVSGNYFDVLGARPVLGRLLRPEDDVKGAPHVMVISYDTWRRRFGGDSAIVGHRVRSPLYQWSYTIVGVAPPGLDYPAGVGAWSPLETFGAPQVVDLVARLAPGATPAAAGAELYAMMQRLHPDYRLAGAESRTFTTAVVGDIRQTLIILTVAVLLLLDIACANVGNLLLLRASGRAREMAIRRAMGATTGDVVRQLLIESTMLAAAGGLLGLGCAAGLLRALVSLAPPQLPRVDMIGIAGAPLAAALGVTFLTVLILGVFPAVSAGRGRLVSPLRLDARSGSQSRARRRLRQSLVASQMALALVMLAGAGLLVRSLERLERVDLGYRAERLSMLELTFPFDRYNTAPKYMALFDRIFTRLRAVPGVVSLTPVIIPPFLGPNVWQWRPVVEGQSQAEADATPFIPVEGGNAEYFRTFGIPIVRGTDFSDADHDGAPAVAVVSEAVAQRLWPGQDAVGKHIRFNGLDSTLWRTVIGVAGDIRFRSLRDATPTIYMPWRQMGTQGTVAIRTSGDLSAALGAMRRAVAELDPQVRIWRARSMDDLLAGPLAQPRLSTLLLSTFGLTALLLAAIGLYGVMASAVREQTRELGVRMALGASPERIRRDVLSGALAVGGAGALAGLAVAVVATRFLVTLLYGVSPVDPVTLLSVCGLLVVVTMVASYVPARRATRIDPALALRADS